MLVVTLDKIKKNTKEHEFLDHARILAETHHERWDGKGYPYGLKETDIPLSGRLMAIADVYDALVSVRPYKKAFSHEEAVSILEKGKGSQFDPILIDLFVEVAEQFNEIAQHHARMPGECHFFEAGVLQ